MADYFYSFDFAVGNYLESQFQCYGSVLYFDAWFTSVVDDDNQ